MSYETEDREKKREESATENGRLRDTDGEKEIQQGKALKFIDSCCIRHRQHLSATRAEIYGAHQRGSTSIRQDGQR